MTQFDEREEWYEFNQETIDALLEDGSQADADYTIEHHFASTDFDVLEKAAVDAFKAGFEVTDAEELILDDGETINPSHTSSQVQTFVHSGTITEAGLEGLDGLKDIAPLVLKMLDLPVPDEMK